MSPRSKPQEIEDDAPSPDGVTARFARGWSMGASSGGPDSARGPAASVEFLVELGRALHEYGTSAPRLEGAMQMVAARLGLETRIYSTPTAILLGFGPAHEGRTALIRVEPGDLDLEKMGLLYEVAVAAADGTLTPREGSVRIADIVARRPRWPAWLAVACHGLAAAAAAVFLSGTAREVALAAPIGLLVGLVCLLPARWPRTAGVVAPLSAAIASTLAAIASARLGPASPFLVALSAVIVLLPGLGLTTAMNELATRNLASGSARLAGAGAQLLGIGFGIALGTKIASTIAPRAPASPIAPPTWPLPILALAVIVAALSFVVLVRARPRDVGYIVGGCALAFVGARFGASALGPELGTFTGAALVALASNAFARIRDRPVATTLVPALLLLVPGSLGLRGVSSLLEQDVLAGVAGSFQAITVSMALVSGLLVANVMLPARRHL